MNTFEYFRGKVGFELSPETVEVMLIDRGHSASIELANLTAADRQLLYADILVYGATIMNGRVKRGSFENSVDNKLAKEYLSIANGIYKDYSDDKYNPDLDNKLAWIEYENEV